jgi:hypothetical protein
MFDDCPMHLRALLSRAQAAGVTIRVTEKGTLSMRASMTTPMTLLDDLQAAYHELLAWLSGVTRGPRH